MSTSPLEPGRGWESIVRNYDSKGVARRVNFMPATQSQGPPDRKSAYGVHHQRPYFRATNARRFNETTSPADDAAQFGQRFLTEHARFCAAFDLGDPAARLHFPRLLNFGIGRVDRLRQEPVEEFGGLLARQLSQFGDDLIEGQGHGRERRWGGRTFQLSRSRGSCHSNSDTKHRWAP